MQEKEAKEFSAQQLDELWGRECKRDIRCLLDSVHNTWNQVLRIPTDEFYLSHLDCRTNVMIHVLYRLHNTFSKDLNEMTFRYRVRKLFTDFKNLISR
jgi:hypothetical protein